MKDKAPLMSHVKCQHGPQECMGNAIMACAIKKNPNPKEHVPFIICMMTHPDPIKAVEPVCLALNPSCTIYCYSRKRKDV